MTEEHGVSIQEARELAHAELIRQGWVFVEEAVEYRHADGRRGRMVYVPHPAAPASDKRISAVKLQQPSRQPTAEDLMNRVPTMGGFIDVMEF